MTLLLIYFFIAVGISFICSILEAVILSTTPTYIEVVKNSKPRIGKRLENQKNDIDKSIGAILTLNTFAHTLGAAGVGAEAVKIFGEEYMFYISALLTILILVFSEIIPKTIGAYYWKELSTISSFFISFLVFITYPLLVAMEFITKAITKDKNKNFITKDELEATVAMGEEAGLLKQKELHIIENIFELSDIKVKDIYTPRNVMYTLSQDVLIESLTQSDKTMIELEKMKEYSRIPIYKNDIDDIVGVIFSKEYFYEFIENKLENKNEIIKPVFKVHKKIPISKLLDLFISRKEHLFIVVDNYDQTAGIVTLEDAIETLLGLEIVDEFDNNTNMRELAKSLKFLKNTI
jgi:CBS domain containing-hemolysin-like protein